MPRYRCEECGNMVTRSEDTGLEYGHKRYTKNGSHAGRCPNRPDEVDPDPSSASARGGRASWRGRA